MWKKRHVVFSKDIYLIDDLQFVSWCQNNPYVTQYIMTSSGVAFPVCGLLVCGHLGLWPIWFVVVYVVAVPDSSECQMVPQPRRSRSVTTMTKNELPISSAMHSFTTDLIRIWPKILRWSGIKSTNLHIVVSYIVLWGNTEIFFEKSY